MSRPPFLRSVVGYDSHDRRSTVPQLHASHINQQHTIRWNLRGLPEEIAEAHKCHAALRADVAARDARAGDEFSITVGNRGFSGKGGREEGGQSLIETVLSWRDDTATARRGRFKGFDLISRGNPFPNAVPDLFIRGKGNL